ncbi:unnamed protein product [Spirodela intermedia]|uniref:Uncharacterized protein n=1 Tax=Spirodela intermedia TaxID=51605 RepID=A0A7I8JUP1_SPIIN|nr:unnamed protein product [Spirodela intermedia]CAA6673333.1 unnamed protein product [Spirodela intermedia]
MATTVSTPLPPTISSCSPTRRSVKSCSAPSFPRPRVQIIHTAVSIPPPSFRHLCPWSGLKHLGISCRHRNRGGKERYVGRIRASLFGVGAPEALVIGVVALLVFGPKVAKNLGQTLRAFQPTIKELQEVSREFKSTLEREIGLDEVQTPTNNSATYYGQATVDPNGTPGTPSTRTPYSSEELLSVTSEQLSASNVEPQAQAINVAGQPQGVPDLQSPEAANTTSTSTTSGSASNSQTTLDEKPQTDGDKP